MNASPNWEDVSVPRGAYISWGTQVGQFVAGKVLEYAPAGGSDFNGEACPQLSVELIEPAASFTKEGQRTDFPAGELVVLNCGQASLKRAVRAADPSPGDLVKITFSGTFQAAKGTGKEFDIKIARGAGGPATQQQAPADTQAAPPF